MGTIKKMHGNINQTYQIIDTLSGLEKVATLLGREKIIAVDLEADSMYHYKEKVCLVQIATSKKSVVIDPLRIKDLSPLKTIFSRYDIKKIFHGSDYDVRSLYRDFNIEINNLFDTELSCRFLGIRETGLEAVLRNRFNLSLNKKYQRKDWSKRPLPEDMIDYAAKDVLYLMKLAQILEKELEKKGRLSWVSEEFEYLAGVRPVSNNNEPLYLKFKGAGRLSPRGLAILESLLLFRKKVAKKKDKPPFKILGNESLMKITKVRPVTLRRLKGTKALSTSQIGMYGNALAETVNKALEIPENDLPVYPRRKSPVLELEVQNRIKVLKHWRDARAKELGIDSSLVFTKALLNTIAIKNPHNIRELETIKKMKNWQRNEFGKDIISALNI